ncbi:MAG: hypothetical protein JKY52_10885 [Flavobacteriales bacterium]|nr:hypothetical protein [Flavobacteriales bacterium]
MVLKEAQLIESGTDKSEQSWYDVKAEDFTILSDYLKDSYDGLLTQVEGGLQVVFKEIKELKKSSGFELVEPNNKFKPIDTPLSGSTESMHITIASSANVGPASTIELKRFND